MKNSYVIGGVLLVAVLIAALVLVPRFFGEEEVAPPAPPPPETPVEPTPAPRPEPVRPTAPEPDLPPLPALEDSDDLVKEALEPMEIPESWIGQGDLIRRLAVVVENAARGDYPRRQLAFLAPAGPFRVVERDDGSYVMDPAGYARYDGYVDMLERMPPSAMASLLDRVQPLLAQALNELGVESSDPDTLLDTAIQQALEVPVLEREIRLEQPNVLFVYTDPELESLTPLQKQMLRTGPENVRRIQAYLRELRAGL